MRKNRKNRGVGGGKRRERRAPSKSLCVFEKGQTPYSQIKVHSCKCIFKMPCPLFLGRDAVRLPAIVILHRKQYQTYNKKKKKRHVKLLVQHSNKSRGFTAQVAGIGRPDSRGVCFMFSQKHLEIDDIIKGKCRQ